ncbi:hypothetical protein HYN69_13140 [Gemmobacter aquarius]|uniref:Lipoprotein n=2 Tax=Paragemmobacter aquarius TaxID=2169400 RepID=A0A2S0UND9_9RHOB|nr:hypothetical protein HYN69_13140 [Gemmobacter aquarius]
MRAKITAQGAALLALCLALLAACTPDLTPDEYELRNMKPSNIVPKSSPKALVTAFERFCLDAGTLAETRAALRTGDYVPVPDRVGELQVWLVDDQRPAVLLNDTDCVVMAQSRTGQTERVKRLVASRFPQAKPVTGSRFENLWSEGRSLIFTRRVTPNAAPSQFMLGISQGS